MGHKNMLIEKIGESVKSVLPIACIVAVLGLFFVPIHTGLFLAFVIGTAFIILGMALFNIGAEISMTQIGSHIGSTLTRSRKIWIIIIASVILGIAITVAEPDLQVLANNAPHIDTTVLIITVSVGVGFFLALSMLRILLRIPLKWLLVGCYGLVFVLALFAEKSFLSVAFDSGGVTTGPMTVPFIMALGVGVALVRSDKDAKTDSFGLVALCSIGPILAVLLLGFLYPGSTSETTFMEVVLFADSKAVGLEYIRMLPHYLKEVCMALLPIAVIFFVAQIFVLRIEKRSLLRILVGILFTFVGLVLFLLGVNVGFSSLGYVLGSSMVSSGLRWMLIPLAMLMGWFIIRAEPAVHVLNRQVSELSAGAISEKMMGTTLAIAIAFAMGLAVIRVLTGISVLWFVVPGYLIALALSFVVPPTFTAIAFDAGGVASGPMTATFMLPLAMGVCNAIGGTVVTDAFGLVAMVAMMPLITVQIMGALTVARGAKRSAPVHVPVLEDYETIELWEVE